MLQSDGKIIIGGTFTNYDGTGRGRVARINPDGSLDGNFNLGAGADSTVYCTTLQPDGKIIIGGDFNNYNGTGRSKIARLNTDGSLDSGFNPGTAIGASTQVRTIIRQPDGKILVGGNFNKGIVRLNADGSPDASFTQGSGVSQPIYSILLQSDGKIIIAGDFFYFNGTARNRIARLNGNGTLDLTFDPGAGADGTIYSSALQVDGKIIIGGNSHLYNGTTRNKIARLNADGSLDAGFDTGGSAAYGRIRSVTLQPDGNIIIGGNFSSANGMVGDHISRLHINGSFDVGFNPGGTGANGAVRTTALQPDGRILIGGEFTTYNGTSRNYVGRVNSDGSLDVTFTPGSGANWYVTCIIPQSDGKVIIGGDFTRYNGVDRSHIARLNFNGSLDATFNPGTGANNAISRLTLLPDGKILITGTFTSYNGTPCNRIARLNADGSFDSSFNPGGTGPNNGCRSMLQPDGRIIIYGAFTSYNGVVRNRVARLNADGTLDLTFNPGAGADWPVNYSAIQPDGKIIVGGDFSFFNYTSRNCIARLNTDGSVDTAFDPGLGANTGIDQIVLQPDGKLIIGGLFTSYAGSARNHIARANPNGSLDSGFDPGTGLLDGVSSSVSYSISLQEDGKVIVGGLFTSYNGIGRNRIARLMGTARSNVRVMLEGPYSAGQMSDALRTLPSFPLTEPFTAMGYTRPLFAPGATIASSILATTGSNAIVDWVLVEMRPSATPSIVSASRAVLLQRDGDIVDLDGVSTVGFSGLAPGNYCVAVLPRNHLPVMLSPSTPFAYGTSTAPLDFTLPTTQLYDADASKNVSGTMLLKAGDVTFDGVLRYVGANNDRDPILTRVGGSTPTATVAGYYREDVNMDGVVKYVGALNDRDPILLNIGGSVPTATVVATLP
ncbi:MAG: delta-60 repeat domain-containing protein [Flavobacteriales bacterium]